MYVFLPGTHYWLCGINKVIIIIIIIIIITSETGNNNI